MPRCIFIRLFSAFFAAFMCLINVAFAQAPLDVRAQAKGDFVRVVVSGAQVANAKVTKQGADTLRLKFAQKAQLPDLKEIGQNISPAIKFVARSDGMDVRMDGLVRYRTLTLGERLFIDMFADKAVTEVKTPAKADATKPKPKATAQPKTLKTTPKSPDKEPADNRAHTAAPAPKALPSMAASHGVNTQVAAPVIAAPKVVKQAPPFKGQALITIGATTGVALAAYERHGYLWIVLSQASLRVPPVVSGPSASQLGAIEQVEVQGGIGFKLKLPPGAHVKPQGAGLVWRLFVQEDAPKLPSVQVSADFGDNAEEPTLHAALGAAASVLRVHEDASGEDLAVVTTGRSDMRLGSADSYVDFDFVPAIVGLVLRPKADGMRVSVGADDVMLSRQGGLRLSALGPRVPYKKIKKAPMVMTPENAPSRIFAFDDWALGSPNRFYAMRHVIDGRVAGAGQDHKLPVLIDGAKFMLARGMAEEGLGYIDMALSYMPMLRDSPEFQAVNGATLMLARRYDLAAEALKTGGLGQNDEMALWRAYMLQSQGKTTEARHVLPAGTKVLLGSYLPRMQALLAPKLIEVALAKGDAALAGELMNIYAEATKSGGYAARDAALAYFNGKLAQIKGDRHVAYEYFRQAADGPTNPYALRSTLELVSQGVSDKTIDRAEAIRKLERFRYGWRGDGLESEVLERLGLIYVQGGEQRRGLSILREAVGLATRPSDKARLTQVMQRAFRELFSGKTREKMSAIEAASVAAAFIDLMPQGPEGEEITLNIAQRMIDVDLLDRAADMIEPLITVTLTPEKALKYAKKAAAVRLSDGRAEDALKDIDLALSRPDVEKGKLAPEQLKAFVLLRAKAKAKQKKFEQAFNELATIPVDEDVLRLKADLAWQGKRWRVAAEAFEALMRLSNLDATRPPSRAQAQLILNEALALNLSGQLPALETLRIGYSDIMRRSELYKPFQVVTRTARQARLADRQTLLSLVSEVDLFKEVLDKYTQMPLSGAGE